LPTIKTRFALEGEKEYKNAISGIKSELGVLDAEAKNISATYAKQQGSAAELAAVSDNLSAKLAKQQEVLAKTREAYDRAKEKSDAAADAVKAQQEVIDKMRASMEKYGKTFDVIDEETGQYVRTVKDADKELNALEAELKELEAAQKKTDATTQAWQRRLLDADTAVKTTENDLSDLTETQNENAESSSSMGDVVDALTEKLGIKLPDGMKKAISGIGNLDPKLVALAGSIGAVVTVAVKAAEALASLTKEAAAHADEISTSAAKFGISTDTLQSWEYAAEFVDVSVDTMTGALTKLTRSMDSAAEGSEKQAEAFKSLGIRVTDTSGNLRDSEDVFYEVVDALGMISNETKRDALAMDLLGKSATDLNPLIAAGSRTLQGYAKEAKDMGYVLSHDDLKALTDLDDAQQKYQKTIEASKQAIAVQFAPALQKMTENATEFIDKIGKGLADTGIVESFGEMLAIVSDLLKPLGDLATVTAPLVAKAFDTIADAMAPIADMATVVGGILTLNWDQVKTGMGLNIKNGQMSAQQRRIYRGSDMVYDSVTGGWTSSWSNDDISIEWLGENKRVMGHAAGAASFRGGLTWVGENGPEAVRLPAGSQIYSASESRDLGGDTIYVTIDAKSVKEFNDIIEIAKNAKQRERMGATT